MDVIIIHDQASDLIKVGPVYIQSSLLACALLTTPVLQFPDNMI